MKSDFERTFSSFMASVSRPHILSSAGANPERHSEDVGRIFEGQLYKFTNVVKGWQYRYVYNCSHKLRDLTPKTFLQTGSA